MWVVLVLYSWTKLAVFAVYAFRRFENFFVLCFYSLYQCWKIFSGRLGSGVKFLLRCKAHEKLAVVRLARLLKIADGHRLQYNFIHGQDRSGLSTIMLLGGDSEYRI